MKEQESVATYNENIKFCHFDRSMLECNEDSKWRNPNLEDLIVLSWNRFLGSLRSLEMTVVVAIFLFLFSVPSVYAQSAGDACTTQGEYVAFNDGGTYTILICDGSNYVESMIINDGQILMQFNDTATTCDASSRGSMRYNDTDDEWEFCGSDNNWRRM